jgi:1,2-diacylglycerol 3-beta-glucosyltransferase
MNFAGALSWIVALLQAPLLAVWLLLTLYLVFLTLSAMFARLRGRRPARGAADVSTRFTILVPAHNEEQVIASCLDSLRALDYPEALRRVIVIADNCTDGTARIAASMGAHAYERTDLEKRGKGYALDWATKRLLREDGGWTDALVIFDADTVAGPTFLRSMDQRLRQGSLALQGRYALLDPFHNWRTALLYSALLLHSRLRPLARHALGLTTLLKGNGMCFARSVVERIGWNAYGLAEDIEYTTTLMDAGITVEYVDEAVLYAEAPQTGSQASSQRMRWESGRFSVARRDGLRLLAAAIRHRSVAQFDWSMDLLIPPMGILVAVPVFMLALGAPFALWPGASPLAAIVSWAWLASLVGAGAYVLGGMLICGADPRAYLYLLSTPVFLAWKLRIYASMLLGRGPRGWVRTERTSARNQKSEIRSQITEV